MIKARTTPSFGRMTGTTVRAKLTVMVIIIGVTGKTIRRRSLITIRMAGFALHTAMFPGKRETGIAMVEGNIRPLRWLMTGTAIRAELTVVVILVSVAGIAIFWRTFVYIVRMAGFAGDIRMRSCQRETRIAMVEGRVLPLARVMTGGTDRAKLSVVGIIPGVTGNAIFWRSLIHTINVTSRTLNFRMATV